MILVVGGIKGGTGKTTIATNLAVIESMRHNTILIDADAQDSARDFMEKRSKTPLTMFATAKPKSPVTKNEINGIKRIYDSIIIDAGGGDTVNQRAALGVADVFLVPFVPSAFDLWTLDKLNNLITLALRANPTLKVFTILNRTYPSGIENYQAESALRAFENFSHINLPVGLRKVYQRAAAIGQSVIEFSGSHPDAKGEMSLLHQFIFEGGFN
jgi:chromosome partitioning protein